MNELYILLQLVLVQFEQIFPYWFGGVIAGSLVSVYAADKISVFVSGLSNTKAGNLAVVPAALLGIASPVCMYGTIPMIAALGRTGVPQYLLASFMVSSILLNPNLFMVSFALGADIAVLRFVLCLFAGILAGLLAKTFLKGKGIFEFSSFDGHRAGCVKKKNILMDIHKSITITGPYFLIGIALTALFDRYIPKDTVIYLFQPNKGFGVLIAASLGVPLYLCGGGTIPLIRSCLENGMSVGSAAAFMLTGPATKLTNLSAVKTILGAGNFTVYLIFTMVFALICGLFIDLIL